MCIRDSVYSEGDGYGRPFVFPIPNCHISDRVFTDSKISPLYTRLCELGSKGIPYFVFDRDSCNLSACCRLKFNFIPENIDLAKMRFCGFQNVTINLPACAYNSSNKEEMFSEIDRMLDLVIKAHIQKRELLKTTMKPGGTMWEMARPRNELDGEPYINMDDAVYIVGIIGLNEAVKVRTGYELHENEDAFNFGLETIMHLSSIVKRKSQECGLNLAIEETPAESATRRLAMIDSKRYRKAITRGTESNPYYTNSIHFRADAPIDPITRLQKQGYFHPMIESGSIVHLFVGEKTIPTEGVKTLIRKVWENSTVTQMTLSPMFTLCSNCGRSIVGKANQCDCGMRLFKTLSMSAY